MDKEVLTLAETAIYLKVSEKTVRRLIDEDAIPCAKVGGQWRFLKPMLHHWLQSQMKVIPQQTFINSLMSQKDTLAISRLINPSCLFLNLDSQSGESVLDLLSGALFDCGGISDKEQFLVQLLEREKMMSTGIGKGVAIPHPRISGQPPVLRSSLALGYCPEGIDFNSIDGTKTHFFVVVASHSDYIHLRILSFFSNLARDDHFLPSLARMKGAEDFLKFLVEKESVFMD